MAKRGNNDGSIRQRKDGTWEARVTIGYNPNGSQKRKSIYGKTQAEVQRKMRPIIQQVDTGAYIEPSKMLLGDWLDTWFTTYGAPGWREKTAEVHKDNIRLYLKPALGHIPICKLRPDHVQTYVNDQAKVCAPATVRKRTEPLQGALKQAVRNRMILTNPAEYVKFPPADPKEIQFLSVAEQKALLEVLPENTQGRAIRFILLTGLRASELCGLQWGDLAQDRFTVRRSAQYVRHHDVKDGEPKQTLSVAPTKTKAGHRVIPLTETAKAILKEQKTAQREQRLTIGDAWLGGKPGSGDTPVFATEVGTVYDKSNLARTLRESLHKAGLDNRGLHALRHTFATNWVRSGADIRTLSEILGHTKVSFTMQQYVHSDLETKLAGLKAIENIV